MIGFFVVFAYSLSINVQANSTKIDKAILIMGQQTEIMQSLVKSLNEKDRDHMEFSKTQQENTRTQREIVRLIDKMVVLMERGI